MDTCRVDKGAQPSQAGPSIHLELTQSYPKYHAYLCYLLLVGELPTVSIIMCNGVLASFLVES